MADLETGTTNSVELPLNTQHAQMQAAVMGGELHELQRLHEGGGRLDGIVHSYLLVQTAAAQGQEACLRWLLAAGAPTGNRILAAVQAVAHGVAIPFEIWREMANKDALHLAYGGGHSACIRVLLEHSTNFHNQAGETLEHELKCLSGAVLLRPGSSPGRAGGRAGGMDPWAGAARMMLRRKEKERGCLHLLRKFRAEASRTSAYQRLALAAAADMSKRCCLSYDLLQLVAASGGDLYSAGLRGIAVDQYSAELYSAYQSQSVLLPDLTPEMLAESVVNIPGVQWQATPHAVIVQFASEGWSWARSAAAPAWWLAVGGGGFSLGAGLPRPKAPGLAAAPSTASASPAFSTPARHAGNTTVLGAAEAVEPQPEAGTKVLFKFEGPATGVGAAQRRKGAPRRRGKTRAGAR